MELMFIAYLYGLIPEIKELLGGVIGLGFAWMIFGSFLVGMFGILILEDEPEELSARIKKYIPFKALIITIALCSLVKTLIPTQDTVKWIVGAYVASLTVDGIKNIEGIDKLPDNAVKYMNNFLSEFENKVEESVDKVNQSK